MADRPSATAKVPSSVGRFAPSPSGPLHFGSLVAGLASWLDARRAGGNWHLRIDDIDGPRTVPGAADAIMRTLETYGLWWDGPVVYQSHRLQAYYNVFIRLRQRGLVYPCTCSRREIALVAEMGPCGLIYPGTCRRGPRHRGRAAAWRVGVPGVKEGDVAFVDGCQGAVQQNLARQVGDFVVRRADGVFSYQLAVVVDDAALGVTDVVRGCDLLPSTPRQIYLQRVLNVAVPRYTHVPLAVDEHGHKLSKKNRAPALDLRRPAEALVAALGFLGQEPPPELLAASVAEITAWGLAHWRLEALPQGTSQPWSSQGGPIDLSQLSEEQ
ncbi:MAG: tRNA glutamyl-Q(34) synthetase GluQRS [Candidatus Competibacterales bacterium]